MCQRQNRKAHRRKRYKRQRFFLASGKIFQFGSKNLFSVVMMVQSEHNKGKEVLQQWTTKSTCAG